MNNPPRAYDMTRKDEVKRWFDEMNGYLRNFVDQGTDFEGRKYALDGFHQLRKKILHEHWFGVSKGSYFDNNKEDWVCYCGESRRNALDKRTHVRNV